MKSEDLEEILLAIAYKEEDSQKADSSFNTLYREYSKLLYAVVRKRLSNMGICDEQILDAVINNTFLNIYENPLLFSFPKNVANKTDGSFKAWIITIAKNELMDMLNEYKPLNVKSNDDKIESAFQETYLDNDTIEISRINIQILEEALKTISERDREILRTLYMYHEEGKNTPSEVLNELCSFFGTTRDNIRKIKERSEKKIVEYFSKHTQLKPLKYAKG